ncbi:MAG: NADP-dependent oxidoreductase [Arthrobacter sp.]|jgi:NADPH:quinone reductase-like Zn-dependent oxidoreductase|nr:NADP-dependent oxidoreductase [Arthrobacter sp.]
MNAEKSMLTSTQSALGGPEVLEIVTAPRPTPRTNEILVRVHAAGLNPTDWKHRATGGFLGQPPFTLGWDVSGVVEAVGIGVASFAPGDEVFGMLSYPFGHGSHAEYVAAPARWFARKPGNVDHVQAGALPLVALTAWQALHDYAGLAAGQRVLIHAGAGGVGHVAIQLAKARGAHVIATASEPKHAFLRELGADETIDYRTEDVALRAGVVDVVLDTQGGETAQRSLAALRPDGVLVSTIPLASPELLAEAQRRGVRAVPFLVDASRADLESMTPLIEDGRLRATIAATFPLRDLAEAHRLGDTGRTAGKIVVTMG